MLPTRFHLPKARSFISDDAKTWRSAALITSETGDLRDAKITIRPQGKLNIYLAEVQLPEKDQ